MNVVAGGGRGRERVVRFFVCHQRSYSLLRDASGPVHIATRARWGVRPSSRCSRSR